MQSPRVIVILYSLTISPMDFCSFVEKNHLLQKGDRVLLAVSGGVDSVVMADLFSQNGFDFGIAHCNFQLRGKESDGDAQFVADLAAKYDAQ